MSQSDSVRHQLQQRQRELRERLAALERDRRHTDNPLSADFAEQAVERENDEVLDRLAETTAAELAQAEEALQRISSGRPVLCRQCGRPIGIRRLRAVPDALHCPACAESLSAPR